MTIKTRRQAIRRMTLLAFGMALGKLDTIKAAGGQLTVPLDQWRSIVFERRGRSIEISVDEIFRSLKEGV